eukprot:6183230-Pleurochrysis_carterae.AAC.4
MVKALAPRWTWPVNHPILRFRSPWWACARDTLSAVSGCVDTGRAVLHAAGRAARGAAAGAGACARIGARCSIALVHRTGRVAGCDWRVMQQARRSEAYEWEF